MKAIKTFTPGDKPPLFFFLRVVPFRAVGFLAREFFAGGTEQKYSFGLK